MKKHKENIRLYKSTLPKPPGTYDDRLEAFDLNLLNTSWAYMNRTDIYKIDNFFNDHSQSKVNELTHEQYGTIDKRFTRFIKNILQKASGNKNIYSQIKEMSINKANGKWEHFPCSIAFIFLFDSYCTKDNFARKIKTDEEKLNLFSNYYLFLRYLQTNDVFKDILPKEFRNIWDSNKREYILTHIEFAFQVFSLQVPDYFQVWKNQIQLDTHTCIKDDNEVHLLNLLIATYRSEHKDDIDVLLFLHIKLSEYIMIKKILKYDNYDIGSKVSLNDPHYYELSDYFEMDFSNRNTKGIVTVKHIWDITNELSLSLVSNRFTSLS